MKTRLLIFGIAIGLLAGLAWPLVVPASAQLGLTIKPETLRYRVFGDEPVASPDGRTFINGWKVVVLRDTASDQCYNVFIMGGAMSATGPTVCPSPTPQ